MPNMFGGDQYDPAYGHPLGHVAEDNPRVTVVGNTTYTIVGTGSGAVVKESDVTGRGGLSLSYPEAVRVKLEKVRKLL